MKIFKKFFVGLLALIMTMSIFTSCAKDPVTEEFINFLNVEMAVPNANYIEITALAGEWQNTQDNETWIANLDKCLEYANNSKDIVSKIELTTEEVTTLKDTYLKMLEKYIAGFTNIKDGINKLDADLLDSGMANIEAGVETLNEYNAGLETIATEKGLTISY